MGTTSDPSDCCDQIVSTGCLNDGNHWVLASHDDGTYELLVAETGDPVNLVSPPQVQTIYQPASLVGPDGWTETGTPTGPAQPPNRALPAPIFDVGNNYQPSNGTVGNWEIEKIVTSAAAGPGQLIIPAGAFPTGGGVFADDQIAAIRVNGVTAPFAGYLVNGGLSAQSVPVTWLKGNNVVQIEVVNTIAGNTAITGRLDAETPTSVIVDCPEPFTATTRQLLFLSNPWNTQAAVNGLGSLISWQVRADVLPVTVVINGVTVAMDLLEVIGSSAQDGRILNDSVIISISGAGRADIVSVRRFD